MEYEYRIEVRGGAEVTVTGLLDTPTRKGAQFGPVVIRPDPLRTATIEVLRSWLNRWTAVRQTTYVNLPVPKTFRVLGQHLYALLIQGAVEEGLNAARREAGAQKTLRVLLGFDDQADDLAQLPWELLWAPGPDDSGNFLAQAHRLVLSRSLLLRGGRLQTTPKEPPLVVYFIVAVPTTPAYKKQRDELLKTLEQPAEYTSSIAPETLEEWNPGKIRARLGEKPYPDIVHIIGVCHRSWREGESRLELCLDDGSGGERWVHTDALLALFDDGRLQPEDRPRLVVLHLWEASPLDFEVTFERLAPRLIHRGITAVLATQYPVVGEAAQNFVRHLYDKLAERKSIEEAVRDARLVLFINYAEDRLFGSPVLYMQSVDSQLLPMQTGTPAGADAGPGSVSTTGRPPRSQQDFLARVLWDQEQPAEILREVEKFLFDPAWPQDPSDSDVERLLTQKVREHASQPDLLMVYAALVKAVQEEGGARIAS